MAWALDPLKLEGPHVQIRGYEKIDIPEIARAIFDPEGWTGTELGHDTVRKLNLRLLKSSWTKTPEEAAIL